MKHTLVWLQRNLRLADNPALQWALSHSETVLLLYLHSPTDEAPWQHGAASCWWLQQSLGTLQQAATAKGLTLNLLRGDALEIIPQLIAHQQIDAISWQRNYEPHLAHRDRQLTEVLSQQDIIINISNDGLLPDPDTLLTGKGTPYRVFTPFYRQLRKRLYYDTESPQSNDSLNNIRSINLPDSLSLSALGLLKPHPWQENLAQHNRPGEAAAQQQLERFINERLVDYPAKRDLPAVDASSQLSAALHIGEVSARQILAALQPLLEHGSTEEASAAESFLRQVIWREFARYILWHFPATSEQCMDQRFKPAFWHHDKTMMTRWQRGETGVTIIDAGMRQLWQSGTIHNRVRMLAASFLTKNLNQPWQLGAHWFWQTLVDADLANNSMGWQWVAGCGVDASPYFRIFNPDTQAIRFDPQGSYRKKWLGDRDLATTKPIVDIADSRKQALARYQQYIKNQSTRSAP